VGCTPTETSQISPREFSKFLVLFAQCTSKETYRNGEFEPARFAQNSVEKGVVLEERKHVGESNKPEENGIRYIWPPVTGPAQRCRENLWSF
jgi:hypothetical protein